MDNAQKVQQRAELHKTIWSIADDLRGSVDGWDFKQYVLGMLFYRYISESLTEYLNSEGDDDFDYAQMSDEEANYGRESIIGDKGYYIAPSELFCNVRNRASQDENLNETLERVFRNIEGSAVGAPSEDDLKGLFADMDVNSPKLGNTVAERNSKLTKLLDKIGAMNLGTSFADNSIDAFGDAYEYLMSMYASNAGKSGGEFFTPQYVSTLLTKIALAGRTSVNKVYDPCCGSGSLLLNTVKQIGQKGVRTGFFGQEINLTTYNLCRINMFLHGIDFNKFDIALGDTLKHPKHWDDEPFEMIVSNPPYSIKWDGKNDPTLINDLRFSPAGVLAPASKADLAFTMHMLSWLAADGTAAIVEFPGVLYRGGAEAKIRKYLVENNYVDTVIQLPPNLFFGTSIATCIIVLKKSKATSDVLFIDASEEFIHVGNLNNLSDENIEKIYSTHMERKEVEHFSKLVPNDEILENDVNLSVSSYVEKKDDREKIDIHKLNAEIKEIVAREQELREKIDAIVADLEA